MSIKRLIRRALRTLGYDIIPTSFNTIAGIPYAVLTSHASYAPWLEKSDFRDAYQIMKNNTLVDVYRCFELWQLAKQTAHLPGDIIEIGVWRGGTGTLLAKASPNKTVYLCDTFSGVVKASENDTGYKGGEHSDTSIPIVTQLAQNMNAVNYKILQGIFPEDTAKEIEGKKFSFCHIDVDTYQSARDCFDWAWPKMPIGGVVVFDDYGFYNCDGVTRLGNDLAQHNDNLMLYNLNGHAVLVKTA
jgi:O-methyltransferase